MNYELTQAGKREWSERYAIKIMTANTQNKLQKRLVHWKGGWELMLYFSNKFKTLEVCNINENRIYCFAKLAATNMERMQIFYVSIVHLAELNNKAKWLLTQTKHGQLFRAKTSDSSRGENIVNSCTYDHLACVSILKINNFDTPLRTHFLPFIFDLGLRSWNLHSRTRLNSTYPSLHRRAKLVIESDGVPYFSDNASFKLSTVTSSSIIALYAFSLSLRTYIVKAGGGRRTTRLILGASSRSSRASAVLENASWAVLFLAFSRKFLNKGVEYFSWSNWEGKRACIILTTISIHWGPSTVQLKLNQTPQIDFPAPRKGKISESNGPLSYCLTRLSRNWQLSKWNKTFSDRKLFHSLLKLSKVSRFGNVLPRKRNATKYIWIYIFRNEKQVITTHDAGLAWRW